MQNCDIQKYMLACSHSSYKALLIQPGLSLTNTLHSAHFMCGNVTGSNNDAVHVYRKYVTVW